MALVTIDAVVDISADIRVLEASCVIAAVACRALEDGVIVGIDVTCRAHSVRVTVTRGKRRVLRVIETGSCPSRGVVAGLARGWEELWLGLVSRIRGVVVVRLVATYACGRKSGVVSVHVTVHALPRRHGVRTGERERRVVVVEGGVCPDRSVVAQLAGGWKTGSGVRRICGPRVVLLVARIAQRAIQRIIVVDVAVNALPWRNGMRASELESCGRVVERGIGPEDGIVAGLAGGWESGCRMVHRSSGIVVIGLMAREAGRARQIVIIVHVAIRTLPRRRSVRSGQRKPGTGVIESCIQPGGGVVALITRLRKIRGNVVWIRGALIILQMATHTSRCRQVVIVIHMAIGA